MKTINKLLTLVFALASLALVYAGCDNKILLLFASFSVCMAVLAQIDNRFGTNDDGS